MMRASVALALPWALYPTMAHALICGGEYLTVPRGMPQDGALVVGVHCDDASPCEPVTLQVDNGSSLEPAPGQHHELELSGNDRLVYWVPEAPFERPTRLRMRIYQGDSLRADEYLNAEGLIEDASPLGPVEASVALRHTDVEAEVCCSRWCGESCIGREQREGVRLELDSAQMAPTTTLGADNQYAFRIIPAGASDTDVAWVRDRVNATLVHFEEAQERYCARVEALTLATGRVHMVEGCADHADLPDPGLRATTRADVQDWAEGCDDPQDTEAVLETLGLDSDGGGCSVVTNRGPGALPPLTALTALGALLMAPLRRRRKRREPPNR